MAKYKDADELLKRLNSCKYPAEKPTMRQATYNAAISDACRIVDAIPAVDIPRWIPVTERLPEKPFGCLVTVWDTDPISMDEFENLLPYFVGWDGEQWNDGEGIQCPFEVIAWMPLPEYKGGEEEC